MSDPRKAPRRSRMKVFLKIGAAIVCFVGGGLFAASASSSDSNEDSKELGKNNFSQIGGY